MSYTLDTRALGLRAEFSGYEKGSEQPLEVKRQVQLLIAEATDPANLAQGGSPTFIAALQADHDHRIRTRLDPAVVKRSRGSSPAARL